MALKKPAPKTTKAKAAPKAKVVNKVTTSKAKASKPPLVKAKATTPKPKKDIAAMELEGPDKPEPKAEIYRDELSFYTDDRGASRVCDEHFAPGSGWTGILAPTGIEGVVSGQGYQFRTLADGRTVWRAVHDQRLDDVVAA